ncbi:MAG: hypothetical protein AABY22_28675 [Nanoarchaeota archaeon]
MIDPSKIGLDADKIVLLLRLNCGDKFGIGSDEYLEFLNLLREKYIVHITENGQGIVLLKKGETK